MNRLINAFHKIATYGAFVSLLGMVVVVTIQVVARFLLPSAPNWTEEIARILFIWLVAFGVAIGIRSNAFVRLELLRTYLGEGAQRKLQIATYATIFIFSLLMLYYSFLFVRIGFNEQSPAIGMNMSVAFASTSVMMLSISLLSLEQLLLFSQPKSKHT